MGWLPQAVVERAVAAAAARAAEVQRIALEDGSLLCGAVAAREDDEEAADAAAPLIVPDEYEGGLSVWECSADLARFVAAGGAGAAAESPAGRFLELGCGSGLPLAALVRRRGRRAAADTFVFQDLNEEVILQRTIPTLWLNLSAAKPAAAEAALAKPAAAEAALAKPAAAGPPLEAPPLPVSASPRPASSRAASPRPVSSEPAAPPPQAAPPPAAPAAAAAEASLASAAVSSANASSSLSESSSAARFIVENCRFFAGPWESFLPAAAAAACAAASGGAAAPLFDLALASECTYRAEKYGLLLQIFSHARASLVASKRYYFGLGGGTFGFVDAANAGEPGRPGFAVAEIVHSERPGTSSIRDIIRLVAAAGGGETSEVACVQAG